MRNTPSFQLTQPAKPAWDAHQHTLFAANGRPTPSITAAGALREHIIDFLTAARAPRAHRAAFANHLCEETPLDPERLLWLGSVLRAQRWASVLDVFVAHDDNEPATRAGARARRLLDYATAMRQWPRCALTTLRRQRVGGGAFDMAMLPPLPTRLRDLRGPLLTVAMQARAMLYEALALPTRSQSRGAIEAVEVLGSFRLFFDFAQRDIRIQARGKSGWVGSKGDADLLEPLPGNDWCVPFVRRLHQTLRVAMGARWDDADASKAATEWLVDTVHRLAERSRLLDHVREQIRNAYPYDRQIVRDLRACTIDLGHRQGLPSREYVWGWRNAAILRSRVAASPQLAAVWRLLVRRDILRVDDDYDLLKAVLRNEGVTDFGWNLLCRYSHALYRPLIGVLRQPESDIAALRTYLCLLQRALCHEPMPFALVRAMFAPHWFSASLDPAQLPLGMIRGAIERVNSALPLGGHDAFIEHEFVPVLGWLARAKPVLDANQQRAPWAWFLARYRSWSEHERRTREGQRWTHGIDGLRWRRFEIVPIRDSATLWAEGELMRTCLSCYEAACLEHRYLIYSVRAGNRERQVAHIGITIDGNGHATLDQVRGFANARVEPALEEFSARLAGMNHGSAPLVGN